jgi:hypothetical protein
MLPTAVAVLATRCPARVVMCGRCPWPGRPLPLTVPPIRCAPGKYPVPARCPRLGLGRGFSHMLRGMVRHSCRSGTFYPRRHPTGGIPPAARARARLIRLALTGAIPNGTARCPSPCALGNALPCIGCPAYGPSVELWEMVCRSVRRRSPPALLQKLARM